MPSRAVLAARLKKRSTDTVDGALRELVAAGAVVLERRRENVTNRYHVMSTPPGARPGLAGEGGRSDAATTAAEVRPNPEVGGG